MDPLIAVPSKPNDLDAVHIVLYLNSLATSQQVFQTYPVLVGRNSNVETRFDAVQYGCDGNAVSVRLHQSVYNILHLAYVQKDMWQGFQFLFGPALVMLPPKMAGAIGNAVLQIRVEGTVLDLGEEPLIQVDMLLLILICPNVAHFDHLVQLQYTNRSFKARLEKFTELVQGQCVKWHVL